MFYLVSNLDVFWGFKPHAYEEKRGKYTRETYFECNVKTEHDLSKNCRVPSAVFFSAKHFVHLHVDDLRKTALQRQDVQVNTTGYGSKRKPLGTTGFGLFFLLPIGFCRYPFLTHTQQSIENKSCSQANLIDLFFS